jgi:hypothetical protein
MGNSYRADCIYEQNSIKIRHFRLRPWGVAWGNSEDPGRLLDGGHGQPQKTAPQLHVLIGSIQEGFRDVFRDFHAQHRV